MYKKPTDPAASKEAIKFFEWAYTKGDAMADELDYVPLSTQQKDQTRAIWSSIN
jgi:phosphate transport system substrate-binding protein